MEKTFSCVVYIHVQEKAQLQEVDGPERASQSEKEEEEEQEENKEERVSPDRQDRMETASATATPTVSAATPPEIAPPKVYTCTCDM